MNKTLKKYLPRYLLGFAIALLVMGHAAKFYNIGIITRLDAIYYDARLRLTMPGGIDDRIAILDIDEKALGEIGRWPWGRDTMSALMDKLFDRYGIRLIGFDIVFAEPDDSSGLKKLEVLSKGRLKDSVPFQNALQDLRPQLDYDARFAKALANRDTVLGFYFADNSGINSGALPSTVLPKGSFDGRQIAFTDWASYGGNLPEFQKNAAAAGHFNPLVDFDGVARRVPIIAEFQGRFYESLSLAMVRAYLGFPPVVPGFPEDSAAGKAYSGMEWIDLPTQQGILRIPVDENAAAIVPYHGYQGSYPYYSAADVLADRLDPEKLRGRIVLMGTTAPGLKDLRVTPVGSVYAGVEVHANLIAGMLDGDVKEKPSFVLGADVLQLLIAAIIMVFLLPALSPMKATLVTLLVFAALMGINLAFWQAANMVIPIAAALLLVATLYAMNMSWGYFVESKTKRQFTNLFGQYVPPELVEEMSRNPESYSMAGRRQDLTVLFSDVRGFTTISEGLSPDQLAALMNEYLGAMTEVIRDHRGTLDKYIGDAIMAFWGAPVADPEHAHRAVVTALEMQQRLLTLNEVLKAKGWPELKIGVGLNTGPMTVGDMGSPVRKAYTVMGDAVNLGSRLESITKQYGVGIIIGEGTWELVKDQFAFRELDRVRVKGKAEPVGIYEPLGAPGSLSETQAADLDAWRQALAAYRTQQWDRAEEILHGLEAVRPHYLYNLYLHRIEAYRIDPPAADWDGVTTFETK